MQTFEVFCNERQNFSDSIVSEQSACQVKFFKSYRSLVSLYLIVLSHLREQTCTSVLAKDAIPRKTKYFEFWHLTYWLC